MKGGWNSRERTTLLLQEKNVNGKQMDSVERALTGDRERQRKSFKTREKEKSRGGGVYFAGPHPLSGKTNGEIRKRKVNQKGGKKTLGEISWKKKNVIE